jgi:importin subunit beta-1
MQVIAAIACIEIPQGQWLDVVPTLLQALMTDQAVELQKVASLETIGYICDGVVCRICHFQKYFIK